jgi:hypothetical protein
MQALIIKDLEISKELTRKDLSAVRGGFVLGALGGNSVANGGGILNTTLGINLPVLTAVEVAPVTVVNVDLANVVASLNTALG